MGCRQFVQMQSRSRKAQGQLGESTLSNGSFSPQFLSPAKTQRRKASGFFASYFAALRLCAFAPLRLCAFAGKFSNLSILTSVINIILPKHFKSCNFFIRQWTFNSRGKSHHQRSRRDYRARTYERTSSNQ